MIKKSIILVLCFISTLSNLSYAKPLKIDLSDRTPVNAGIRSLLIPGWGQFFNEDNKKGCLSVFGVGIFGGLSYFFYTQSEKTYEDYKKTGVKNGSLYSDYESEYNNAVTASYVAAGFWLYSVIDAFFSAKKYTESANTGKIKLVSGNNGYNLVYNKRF